MSERRVCRQCEGKSGGRKSFVNPREKTLMGTVLHRVRTIASGQKSFRLDQIGLTIESVMIKGHVLIIELDH